MNSKPRLNPGIQTIAVQALQNLYSTIRFTLKRIYITFYCRNSLYKWDHSIITAWCNYDALVSFTVVTLIVYMYLFNLYLNLFIYLCTWSYLLLLLLLSFLFLTLTLIRHIDWHELELVLCIMHFSTILSRRNKSLKSNPIQSLRLRSDAFLVGENRECGKGRGCFQTVANYQKSMKNYFSVPLMTKRKVHSKYWEETIC